MTGLNRKLYVASFRRTGNIGPPLFSHKAVTNITALFRDTREDYIFVSCCRISSRRSNLQARQSGTSPVADPPEPSAVDYQILT